MIAKAETARDIALFSGERIIQSRVTSDSAAGAALMSRDDRSAQPFEEQHLVPSQVNLKHCLDSKGPYTMFQSTCVRVYALSK